MKKWSMSKIIAVGVLSTNAMTTFVVLYLCYVAITRSFMGALPFLTTLIGAMQAATAIVLSSYFKKSTKENTAGGIVYDTVMKSAACNKEI